ncbi:CBPM Carboxypeptidase, partial [Polyodon spathula]|nr:carboxypeptidase M-like [Polyodon spathula]MBN3280823.1 CBPM Carboxypeptidase [Polyodon spathula]
MFLPIFLHCLCIGSMTLWVQGLDFNFHDSRQIEAYLQSVSKNYSTFTNLYSIGKSVQGRELWVLVLGKYPIEHKVGIPEFKYVGNMHGDEVVGREMLLHLIDYLVKNYRTDSTVTRLIDSCRLHILPSMNPDGFEASAPPDCIFSKGRYNRNSVDLNRNFPDTFSTAASSRVQPETQAVMDWIQSESFVLSANLHGGTVVASYPYDNSNGGSELVNGESRSPDHDVYVHLAKTYSYNHTTMHTGTQCGSSTFPDGITNGYQWYTVIGGMQDYNYVYGQCFEITLELSCCKYPPADQLAGFWQENRAALLAYMQQVHLGVKGQVLDVDGNPIPSAVVEVQGRNNICPYKTNKHGEYYRLLLPGTYTFVVTVPGSEPMKKTLQIPNGPASFSALKYDFVFRSNSPTSETVAAESCTTADHNSDNTAASLQALHFAILLALAGAAAMSGLVHS